MKKILSGLLFSTILLAACGSDDVSVEEKGGVMDDEIENVDIVVEEEVEDEIEEEVKDEYKSYFGTTINNTGEAQKLVAEKELAGLYVAKSNINPDKRYTLPTTTYLEINEDGTFTRYRLRTPEVTYDSENNTVIDKSFEKYLASTTLDDMAQSNMSSEINRLSKDRTLKATYIDESNQIHVKEGIVPTFEDIEIVSGKMKEAYGEIQFESHEISKLRPSYNQEGEVEFSEVVNFTHETSVSPPFWTSVDFLDGLGDSFNKDMYQVIESSEITYDIFLNDGVLKSAYQVFDDMNDLAKDKTSKKLAIGDTARHTRFFMNNNEVLHHLITTNIMHNILTDTEEYVGYTEDNREVKPDIVFEHGGAHYTLVEEGELMKFVSSNSTWEPWVF